MNKRLLAGILSVVCVMFAVTRFMLPAHALSFAGTFQALAHLFVGGLFGAYFASKEKPYLWFALIMVAVEIAAAIITRL